MTQTTGPDTTSRANTALGIAVGGFVLYVIAMIVAQEDHGWLWPLSGLLGAAGAITGWMAGKPKPRGRALAAVIVGGLVFAVILAWIIWAAATGNFD